VGRFKGIILETGFEAKCKCASSKEDTKKSRLKDATLGKVGVNK